jgi:Domain of unknown function (DUF5107)
MSKVRLDTVRMPVVDVGPDNPLPLLRSLERLDRPTASSRQDDLPEGMEERLRYGRVIGAFPYSCQDAYGRELALRDVRVAVLENDRLRATFLVDYGARLWSLQDLSAQRELLFNPGKIQLANLGLRNAWFAGGIEWNLGTAGHSPFTCAPLHTMTAEAPDGSPALRLYEYERLRGVVFQLDAWLPDGAPLLKVHVRLHNPQDEAVPMWWWSNVAVPETPDVRIVAPAETAWHYKYDGVGPQTTGLPVHDGSDATYPGRAADAAEYFFRLSNTTRPWIAAVNGDGSGVVQASTSRLLGRKVFRWGTGPGGRRWQEWLGDARRPYLEIQGGITETQMEHLRLPAGATWSWVEAYGPVQVEVDRLHGGWADARSAVGEALKRTLEVDLEDDLAAASVVVRRAPQHKLVLGSGWGALEQLRRESAGEAALSDAGAPFGCDTLAEDQQPWLDLLTGSALETWASRREPPCHNVKGGDWALRLVALGGGWLPTYLRGLLAQAEQDIFVARLLFERSVMARPNSWALRALALLDLQAGNIRRAADVYLRAHSLSTHSEALAVETAETLLLAGRPSQALTVLQGGSSAKTRRGRVRLLEGQALAEMGETALVRDMLEEGLEVPDLREGEDVLHSLWSSVFPGAPIPAEYDFRMRST